MIVEIISVGTEILLGDIENTNAAWLSRGSVKSSESGVRNAAAATTSGPSVGPNPASSTPIHHIYIHFVEIFT